ncbi:MAG TPA: hypothetical protein VF505_07560 [Thermoanaerobaculia bacterium]
MTRLFPAFVAAVLLAPLPCSAHAVVDLAIRFVAPEYVAANTTVPVDVIVDANAYDTADDVTLQIHVSNARTSSADDAWRCTNTSPDLIECTAGELAAGSHEVHLDVVAPSAGLLQIRATVGTADGFDPREDNNDVSLTIRVFDPARCTQRAPQRAGDLQWTESAGAASYDVFYGIDGETPHLQTSTSLTHSSTHVPGGRVTWFVRARFDSCPALDSPVATFESNGPPMQLATATVARDPLIGPASVAIDGTDVIVADAPAKKLYTFDTTTGALTPMPLYGDIVSAPPLFDGGITIGPGSFLYDADRGTHSVRFSDSTNYMYFVAGQPGSAGTIDGQGNAARFDAPTAIATTTDSQMFVTDAASNVVRRVAYNNAKFDFDVITVAGVAGPGAFSDGAGTTARFNEPTGVAVDAAGNVLVADRGNQVIRKIAPDGSVSTIAGIPTVAGHRDGDRSAALFNRPCGIAIDPWGNLYVTEEGNHDIRKIAPNGRVTTVAGDPSATGSSDGAGSDAHFTTPSLLAIAGDGTLWIPDAGNGRLVRAGPFGGEKRRAAHR